MRILCAARDYFCVFCVENAEMGGVLVLVFRISYIGFLYMRLINWRDTVRTVYHPVIYMQSNKIHKVILMSKFIQHLC